MNDAIKLLGLLGLIVIPCYLSTKRNYRKFISITANVATIIGVFFAVFNFYLYKKQIDDYFAKPKLGLEFFIKDSRVSFQIKNNSDRKIAENVFYNFSLTDIYNITTTFSGMNPPADDLYINPGEAKHGFPVLPEIDLDSEYMGSIYLSCKYCELTRYFVYVNSKDYSKSWFAEAKEGEYTIPFLIDAINNQFPKERRHYKP